MATPKTNFTPEQLQDGLNEIALHGESKIGLGYDEIFDLLAKMDSKDMQEITSNYFKFEKPGQVVDMAILGHETAQIDGKTVEVVKFADREGQQFICGDKVLYTATKRLTTLPAFCRVTYVSDIKNKVGTYKNLSVRTISAAN